MYHTIDDLHFLQLKSIPNNSVSTRVLICVRARVPICDKISLFNCIIKSSAIFSFIQFVKFNHNKVIRPFSVQRSISIPILIITNYIVKLIKWIWYPTSWNGHHDMYYELEPIDPNEIGYQHECDTRTYFSNTVHIELA